MYNKTNIQKIDASGYSSGVLAGAGSPYIANTLVSAAFEATNGIGNSNGNEDRKAIPHTVIKHTLNLHNGGNASPSNIVLSYSFYYDNTRGRMRYYPFVPINAISGADDTHDVIFVPEIITNLHQDNAGNYDKPHEYDDYYNNDLILPGGALNYFPTSELPLYDLCGNPPCSSPLPGNTFATGPFVDFIYPSPFTLYSAPLRSSGSQYLAGYESNQSSQIAPLPGIRHSYFIDQNTDLNIINPFLREIFNPSEATITANNLIFPLAYTFKTIRGVYPSPAEVTEVLIPANGYSNSPSYYDLRTVPVNTDLTSENTSDAVNFPLSAATNTKHLYASRYYLDNLYNTFPKLTIEQCVGLFDCTFDVKEGSSMIFSDYPAHYGTEDNSNTNVGQRQLNRFKIQTLGGAVLRNLAPVQYLQNGNIIQPTPLHYTATDQIIAGNGVDPDADINALNVNHDYVVQNGADVTLEANNFIYLKPGFSAMSGSTFTAKIATTLLTSLNACPDKYIATKLSGNDKNKKKDIATESLQAYPNPSDGLVKLHHNFLPVSAQLLEIKDTFGRTVYTQSNYNSSVNSIDFSNQPSGVYMAILKNNGKTTHTRFVIQK